jgi:hypothetical protein
MLNRAAAFTGWPTECRQKMKRMTLLALAIGFAFSGYPAAAQDAMPDETPAPAQTDGAPDDSFTGADLRDACAPASGLDQSARAMDDKICTSYLRGLTEGLFLQRFVEDSGALACFPQNEPISVAEARDDVLQYLAANPAAADRQAGVAGVLAIVRAHSCGAD